MRPRVLCGVCRRRVPLRKDGRLEMHRAVRGRRPACEGSGSYSARVFLAGADQADAEPVAGWEGLTTAARFNAAEQWHAADTTYAEAELMTVCGAASPEAVAAAWEAAARAVEAARKLASYGWLAGGGDGI
jgi:hypothetical protein